MEPINLEDLHELARELMPPASFGYYEGGADDEVTVADNRDAFQRLRIAYRTMVDITQRDASTTLLGAQVRSPIILAPTALHRLAHPEGEAATARAAADAGALMTLSTISSIPLEDVAGAAPGAPRWFQLYLFNDDDLSVELIERAEAAGYGALVLTADAPLLGRRERDLRLGFTLPDGVEAAHFKATPRSVLSSSATIAAFIHQPNLDWARFAWVRSLTSLPIIVKGIVRADDADAAVANGAAAIWVSNHGGRQLDTCVTTADALPGVVAAVRGRVPVIVDGGIRRGTDVVKGIALGADAVAIGRPQLWGLAAAGEQGVTTALRILHEELLLAMALCGARTLAELTPDLIVDPRRRIPDEPRASEPRG
jgi:4-hydroxymandelate oxidase